MGILDRLRRRLPGRRRAFRLPPGFTVETWTGIIGSPSFTRMDGGVWMVSTGPPSDANVATLRALFAYMRESLTRPSGGVRLSDDARLEALCRRAPKSVEVERLVVWTLQDGSLEGWVDDPALLEEVLRSFAALRPPARQIVLAARADLDDAPWFFALLRGLEVDVRELPADGRVLVEARRRDGGIVSAVLGSPVALPPIALPATRADLEGVILRGAPRRPPSPLAQATVLRGLIADVIDGKPEARDRLARYFLERRTPLLFLVRRAGDEQVRSDLFTDGSGASHLEVLPDLDTANRVNGGEVPEIVARTPAETLRIARETGLGLSLVVVRGAEVARALLGADVTRDLAGRFTAA
jgi:hypothetical protein